MRVRIVRTVSDEISRAASEATSEPAAVDGFEAFYRDALPTVQRVLCVALGDETLGREAADEAFLRCYRKWRTVGGYDNPTAWVIRVGRNWGTSRWRRLRREVRLADPHDATAGTGSVSDVPATLNRAADHPELTAAIDGLGEDARAVLLLRLVLDWSTDDTAEALGIAPGTVKSRLHRALAALREELAE